MMLRQKLDPHIGKQALLKTSVVISGQNEPIFQDPFALSRIIAAREMLEHIILPARGKKFDDYKPIKRAFETAVRISSHKAVSKTSEISKFNLKASSQLKKDDVKDRRPLFEL